jgi:hypothetical protein
VRCAPHQTVDWAWAACALPNRRQVSAYDAVQPIHLETQLTAVASGKHPLAGGNSLAKATPMTYKIDKGVARRRQQPSLWILRYSVPRPSRERCY